MGGRGLEGFESVLFGWGEDGPMVSAVLYNLPLYNQEDHSNGEQESHLDGENPHLYMSVDGAEQMLRSIEAMLINMDPAYAQRYGDNLASALMRLDGLKREMEEAAALLSGRRVILMNEALIYVARDYGLEVAEWIDRESGVALYDQELGKCIERMKSANADVALIEKQAPQAFVEALEAEGFRVAKIDILSTHSENDGFEVYLNSQKSNKQSILDTFDLLEEGQ